MEDRSAFEVRRSEFYCAWAGGGWICACTCLYPAGTSKCDGSTGADEKFDVVICVSIRMALVGGG
jgi:hypothetical protein